MQTVTRQHRFGRRERLAMGGTVIAILFSAVIAAPPRARAAQTPLPTRIDPGEVVTLANGATIENQGNLYLVIGDDGELQGGQLIHIVGALFDVQGAPCRVVPSGMGCVVPANGYVMIVEGPLREANPPVQVRAGNQETLANDGVIVNQSRLSLTVSDYGDVEGGRQVVIISAGTRAETSGGATCRPLSSAKWDCVIPTGGSAVFRNG